MASLSVVYVRNGVVQIKPESKIMALNMSGYAGQATKTKSHGSSTEIPVYPEGQMTTGSSYPFHQKYSISDVWQRSECTFCLKPWSVWNTDVNNGQGIFYWKYNVFRGLIYDRITSWSMGKSITGGDGEEC